MGRPGSPNPVAVAFGQALRLVRAKQGKKTSEISSAADIADSFYRLIESGRNHPSISKAVPLHLAFNREISYEALIFLISTIAGSEAEGTFKRGEQLQTNVGWIRAALPENHKFRTLLTKFLSPLKDLGVATGRQSTADVESSIFENSGRKGFNIRKVVTLARLDEEVFKLLTLYPEYGTQISESARSYSRNFFAKIPSVYKWMLDRFRDGLTDIPRVFTPEGSWDWEAKNKKHFEELVAVCYSRQLVGIKNLTRYNFDYLWNPQFRKATFLLLDEPQYPPASILANFWTTLKLALTGKENPEAKELLQKCDPSIEAKTVFVNTKSSDERRELDELLKSLAGEAAAMNAMWFFKTNDMAVIGAASYIEDKEMIATRIRFLTFEECERALSAIEKILWKA